MGKVQETLSGSIAKMNMLSSRLDFLKALWESTKCSFSFHPWLKYSLNNYERPFSVFTTTVPGFWQFPSALKGRIIHLKWRGDPPCRLHWSQLRDVDPLDLPPLHMMSVARPHSCAGGREGRQFHLHTIATDGHIPLQLHFRSRRGKSQI